MGSTGISLGASAPGAGAGIVAPAPLTLGVEEEFLLLDPHSGQNMPVAGQVAAALADDARAQSRLEFRRSMLEMVTPVCSDLRELGQQLMYLRLAAAEAATGVGARLVAVGATPVEEPEREPADDPRFRAIAGHYGPIGHDPAVCGLHVHVGVADRALAVKVCNHLRVWLPVVQALAVNSPLYAGADTGHASWRSMQLERWPSLGPTPYFESIEDYDRTVNTLIASGAMLDATMVLWHARPSATYPTVEVRICDVCPTVEDSVLIAGLIRALVATALNDIAVGSPAVPVRDCILRAAHWNAAHTGLDGTLIDLRRNCPRPAWDLVHELFVTISAALQRHGDFEVIRDGLARLRQRGTGAARQRGVYRKTRDIHAVLAHLAKLTVDR